MSVQGHSRHSRYPGVSGLRRERTFGQCNEWTLHRDITRQRTPDPSMALTPSTTHGGHPASRGALVATTMASSVRAAQCDIHCRGHVYGSSPIHWNAGSRMCHVIRGMLLGPSMKLLICRATSIDSLYRRIALSDVPEGETPHSA